MIVNSQSLKPSLSLYQMLFEQAREAMVALRFSGEILIVNPAATRVYGYEEQALIGLNFRSLITPASQFRFEECLAQIDSACGWFEAEQYRQDGNTFAAEVCLQETFLDQEPILLATVRDVTAYKSAGVLLEECEVKYRALGEATTVQARQFSTTLKQLQQTQSQLIQTEKMSSLGQLVAGIAHEINNPVNFIYGNLFHVSSYTQDLLALIELYQRYYPTPAPEIETLSDRIDLDFLSDDLLKLLSSMNMGVERIQQIVVSLKNFSRLDEAEVKPVDIHAGLDSTLLILNHRLKKEIQVVKQYQELPLVECYPAQLNQVFMHILSNAIDTLQAPEVRSPKRIIITTEQVSADQIQVKIADNGAGIPDSVKSKLFDPFFTTKPVGQGTGLGLSICYQIMEQHQGKLDFTSEVGQGTEFTMRLPLKHTES